VAEIRVADSVGELDGERWNALVGDDSPFLEWEWLSSLEDANCVGPETGWQSGPLVASEGGRLIAACPMYVKSHSDGEFVFDWGWADAAFRAGIDYYPKLLVGVPFTPVSGARMLVAADADRATWEERLSNALRDLCLGNRLSGAHVNFCRESEFEALSSAGFLPRIGFQYHWINHGYESFDDYLGCFRSKRRNQIRRERRALAEQAVRIEVFTGEEIPDALFEQMYRFYLATIRVRSWGRQYLTLQFFELLRERYRDRLVFMVAYHAGEPIAGTFNVRKGDALYGRYWGTLRPLRHLHFNVCYYAAIEYCIKNGIQRFEPGAGGDYKQVRGFDAHPTLSGHFLSDPRLAAAVKQFLNRERVHADETITWLREQSALKQTRESQ